MPAFPVVLVIEDHNELGDVIRDVLTEEGYRVLSVRDQFAAVATLRSEAVDLVVADLPAPGPGSPDPLAEIARDFSDIPLIVIGEESDDVPLLGPWRRSDGRVTLRRPFKLDELIALSRELVG